MEDGISSGAKFLKTLCISSVFFSLSAIGSYQIILFSIYIYISPSFCIRKIAPAVLIYSRGDIGGTKEQIVSLTQFLSQCLWSKGRLNILGDIQADE